MDVDDPDPVMDLVAERLLALQIDDGLPIHVVPLRTLEREAQLVAAQRSTPLLQSRGQAAFGH